MRNQDKKVKRVKNREFRVSRVHFCLNGHSVGPHIPDPIAYYIHSGLGTSLLGM